MEEERYNKLYIQLLDYVQGFHNASRKKIKKGLRSLLIVPLIFLILLFMTGSSKIVFLLLWIISMFSIGIYLITIEYVDYELQNKLKSLYVCEQGEGGEIPASFFVSSADETEVIQIESQKESYVPEALQDTMSKEDMEKLENRIKSLEKDLNNLKSLFAALNQIHDMCRDLASNSKDNK